MEIIVILPFQVACSQFLSIAKESRSSNLSEVFCFWTFVCLCPGCKHQPRWSVNSCSTITCCQIHSIRFNSSQIHRYRIPVVCVLSHIHITIKIHRNSAVSQRWECLATQLIFLEKLCTLPLHLHHPMLTSLLKNWASPGLSIIVRLRSPQFVAFTPR
jgi:hypothetical protein